MSGEHGQSCVTDLLRLAAIGGGEFSEEMTRQNGDILDSFAQSRNCEGYYVQAIKKVFAKKASGNLLLQLLICRGDHAYVDGCGVSGSHALEPLLLEDSKHFGLRAQAHIAHFIQEQRAIIGLLEFADLVFAGAGEAAFHVAK